ncbi:MAG: preprotein translocase subunit YajC [Ornithinimicrobium sp.]
MPFIASAASGGESGSLSLLIIAIPLALLGYLMIAQRRRAKRQEKAQAALELGDAVMTRAGMFGVITSLDGPTVALRVAPGVEIRFDRRAVVPASIPGNDSSPDDDGDDTGPSTTPHPGQG